MNNKQSDRNQQQTASQSHSPANSKSKLAQLWSQHRVPKHYQQMFMKYIQKSTLQQQENALQQEIELTLSKKSKHFVLSKLLADRITLIQQLTGNLENLQKAENAQHSEEQELKEVCLTLGQLRRLNYDIFEEVNCILDNFEVSDERSCIHYVDLFKQYDKDFGYLQRTVLVKYIPFGQEFDPFLLSPTRRFTAAYQSNSVIKHSYVEEIFTFTPSQMFKLLKARSRMIDFIASYSDKEQIQLILSRNENEMETKRVTKVPYDRSNQRKKSGKIDQYNPNIKKMSLNNNIYLQGGKSKEISTPSSKMKRTSVRLKFRNKEEYFVSQNSKQSESISYESKQRAYQNKNKLAPVSSILKVDISNNKLTNSPYSRAGVRHNGLPSMKLNRQIYKVSNSPVVQGANQEKDIKHRNPRFSTQIAGPSEEYIQQEQIYSQFHKGKLYPLQSNTSKLRKRQNKQPKEYNENRPKRPNIQRESYQLSQRKQQLVSEINEKYKILAQQQQQAALRQLNFMAKLSKRHKDSNLI